MSSGIECDGKKSKDGLAIGCVSKCVSCPVSGSSPKHVYIPASANVSLLIRRDPFLVTVAEVSAKLLPTEGALL